MLAVTNSARAGSPWPSELPALDSRTPQLSGACALLAALIQAQCTTQASAKTDIEHGFERLDELKKQLAESTQQAKDAANDAGFFGFLGDIFGNEIAQVIGAVAAVAATIATYGAAAPLLVIAIAEALQIAAKVGAELGLDPKICMAIAIAAVAVGFCSGGGAAQAAGTIADVARGVTLCAKVTQGAATIAGGSLHLVSARYQAQQLRYQADAMGYRSQDDAAHLELDDAFSALERALRAEQREASTASQIIQDDANTDATLGRRI